MTWVFENSRSKKNARLVLLAIADCANDEGRQAYPSMAKLKQKTGLGDRAVTNLVSDLEKLGELEVQRNAGPKGCNLYRVIMTPAEYAPPQNMHPAKNAPRTKRQSPPQKTTVPPAESAPGTIKEPSRNRPKKKPIAGDAPRPDVEKICNHLIDRLVANGCKRPTITARWRNETRLLLDADDRTVDQVIRCIDWATSHHFWKANILSMPALRKHYDRLRQVAESERSRASPNGQLTEVNGLRLKPETAADLERRKRFEAMEAAGQQLAIGGPG